MRNCYRKHISIGNLTCIINRWIEVIDNENEMRMRKLMKLSTFISICLWIQKLFEIKLDLCYVYVYVKSPKLLIILFQHNYCMSQVYQNYHSQKTRKRTHSWFCLYVERLIWWGWERKGKVISFNEIDKVFGFRSNTSIHDREGRKKVDRKCRINKLIRA